MPSWRYSAPATLDFGGAWVSVGASGRDLRPSDLSLSVDDVAIDAANVTVSVHAEEVGVYNLAWRVPTHTMGAVLTVAYAADVVNSPVHGAMGAFSASAELVDCSAPEISSAYIVKSEPYACADTYGCEGSASAVVVVGFSEAVYSTSSSRTLSGSDLEIGVEGGVARLASVYTVAEAARRRTQEDGARRVAVALVLTDGATGDEQVTVRARSGAIRDDAGWAVGATDADVYTAIGSIAAPYTDLQTAAAASALSSEEAKRASFFRTTVGVIVIVVAAAMAIIATVFCLLFLRRKRLRTVEKRRASLRKEQGGDCRLTRLQSYFLQDADGSKRVSVQASTVALAIVSDFEGLRARELDQADASASSTSGVTPESPARALVSKQETARWVDELAETVIAALYAVRPPCALPRQVVEAARDAYRQQAGAHPSDDVTALRALTQELSQPADASASTVAALLPLCLQAFVDAGLARKADGSEAGSRLVRDLVSAHTLLGERESAAWGHVFRELRKPLLANASCSGGEAEQEAAAQARRVCERMNTDILHPRLSALNLQPFAGALPDPSADSSEEFDAKMPTLQRPARPQGSGRISMHGFDFKVAQPVADEEGSIRRSLRHADTAVTIRDPSIRFTVRMSERVEEDDEEGQLRNNFGEEGCVDSELEEQAAELPASMITHDSNSSLALLSREGSVSPIIMRERMRRVSESQLVSSLPSRSARSDAQLDDMDENLQRGRSHPREVLPCDETPSRLVSTPRMSSTSARRPPPSLPSVTGSCSRSNRRPISGGMREAPKLSNARSSVSGPLVLPPARPQSADVESLLIDSSVNPRKVLPSDSARRASGSCGLRKAQSGAHSTPGRRRGVGTVQPLKRLVDLPEPRSAWVVDE